MSGARSPQSVLEARYPAKGQRRRSEAPSRSSQSNEGTGVRVKSLLLEPRRNGEPPKLSASMEYTGPTPDLGQRKRAALKALREVVAEVEKGAVDLGFSEQQRECRLVQQWSLEVAPKKKGNK